MSTGVRNTTKFNIALLAILIALILCSVTLVMGYWRLNKRDQGATFTREASERLTEAYGSEIHEEIERFERTWQSWEAYNNPEIQSTVAMGQYLKQFGLAFKPDLKNRSVWRITVDAEVTDLLVYDYESDRFFAGACVETLKEEVTPERKHIKSLPRGQDCGLYVFVRQDRVWRLAAYFSTSLPYSAIRRDWTQRPEWIVELMGEELPQALPEPRS